MIGRIEKVELREVWKKEEDFTTWLFDNLDIVGEELDMDLTPNKKEAKAGSFFADIVAEDAFGQKVIIENQLEKTDHDHLGKILTYVSNLDAKIAVWVSSDPRPEHQTAIEWLNETGSDVQFYLVKIEALRIGDSEPAAYFSVVTGPSEKTNIVSGERKEMAERHKFRLDFWQTLLEKSKEKTNLHANISPGTANYVGASSGVRGLTFNYVTTFKAGQVELYIDRGKNSEDENKKIFDKFYSKRSEIEKDFGGELNWERLDNRRACRISKRFEYASLGDSDKRDKLQDDMIDAMIRLEKALKEHIKKLRL